MQSLVPVLAVILILAPCGPVTAGMPSPIPDDPERVLRLNDSAAFRFQAISFFLLVFFLSALAVKLLWNALRKDFPTLSRLSFGRAVVGVFLWGLLFVIVLTMISGARELMTPGAWKKQGFTYRIEATAAGATDPDSEGVRRQHLERLRTALWQFAATHDGRFPTIEEITVIPSNLWKVPESGGLYYLYVPGQSAGHLPEVLAFEPELDPTGRLVLETNGEIHAKKTSELRFLTSPGK